MKTYYINQSKKCRKLITTIRTLKESLPNANPLEEYELIEKLKIGLAMLQKENNIFLNMIIIELK
jgi:hypothetical protein